MGGKENEELFMIHGIDKGTFCKQNSRLHCTKSQVFGLEFARIRVGARRV